MRLFLHAALCLFVATFALAEQKRAITLADMFAFKRVSDPSLSPDGKWVAFTVTTPDLQSNKNPTDVWIAPTTGGEPKRITTHAANDRKPAWSPDGKWIAFESTRSGSSQIWLVTPDGGEAKQLTTISTDATDAVWSPDGKMIAFVSEVFPENSDKPFAESDSLNKKKLDQLANGPVKAKVFTKLMYRHWDSWRDGKRKHIFVQPVTGGNAMDLTPGDRDAVPFSDTFSSGIEFAFSPDSKEIAYTASPANIQEEAWNTNHDIYTVSIDGKTRKQMTTHHAADGYPRYSPDGKYLLYRSQSVAGFEADRWQLMLVERGKGKARSLTQDFDASVQSPVWAPDSRTIFFHAEEKGNIPIFNVSTSGNDVKKVFERNVNRNISVSADGKKIVFAHTSAVMPTEIFSASSSGDNLVQITNFNKQLLNQLDMPAPESIWFEGEGGTQIQAWLYKPPGFSPDKKYPFVYLVHGGPQGAWTNSWSYRWNPALWAAQGYVVMAPNPRGSTGFGQTFVNEISRDWGGRVFTDLMKGLDYAESLPYVDKGNKAAAGASYGGYMMNWFQAKAGDRFKTLVTHCGVYNFSSMYGTTEEVWFDEWDHGGPPWNNMEEFEKFSPHRFAKNFKTPNLVIHNEKDYRVPISEGMQLFTTLQRQGIPSKMLYFPDEGHWVNKPANSELWHNTVFDWLKEYLKQPAASQ